MQEDVCTSFTIWLCQSVVVLGMEQEKVLKLINSLSIIDEDDGDVVTLQNNMHALGVKKLSTCLLCKVLAMKPMHRDLFWN